MKTFVMISLLLYGESFTRDIRNLFQHSIRQYCYGAIAMSVDCILKEACFQLPLPLVFLRMGMNVCKGHGVRTNGANDVQYYIDDIFMIDLCFLSNMVYFETWICIEVLLVVLSVRRCMCSHAVKCMMHGIIVDERMRGVFMSKIIVVNAGPRKGWNTDMLIGEAAKGAESVGAAIERYDLFRLEKYTGCISCFGCKKEKFKGHCVCKDGLTPVLNAIREADGLIIGSPNYLSNLTASFRALYERLIFQNLTYNAETPCCNEHPIPVLLVMTSNAPDTMYTGLIDSYQQTFDRFVGPTQVLVSGDTLQLKDYAKTDWPWSIFDPEAKKLRHETVFPQEMKKAFEMGASLATSVAMGNI